MPILLRKLAKLEFLYSFSCPRDCGDITFNVLSQMIVEINEPVHSFPENQGVVFSAKTVLSLFDFFM